MQWIEIAGGSNDTLINVDELYLITKMYANDNFCLMFMFKNQDNYVEKFETEDLLNEKYDIIKSLLLPKKTNDKREYYDGRMNTNTINKEI